MFIIDHFPISSCNTRLLEAIINKALNSKQQSDKSYIKIAYFIEALFFEIPKQYSESLKIFWKMAHMFLEEHIQALKKLES
jgi:chromosomal replication initiation ATPase DnaA